MRNTVFKTFNPVLAKFVVLVAILTALELLIVCGIISFHIPFKADPGLTDILFHYRKGFMPERELQLYGIGIINAVICMIGMIIFFHQRFEQSAFLKSLKHYGIIHLVIVLIEIGLVFKLVTAPTLTMAWGALYGLLCCSFMIKIFWSEISQCFG